MGHRLAGCLVICFSLNAQAESAVEREYSEKFVGVEEWGYVNGWNWGNVSTRSRFYLGRYRKPLDNPSAFFAAVDRLELAVQYEEGTRIRARYLGPGAVLLIGGVATTLAGAALGVPSPFRSASAPAQSFGTREYTLMGAGAGAALIGIVTLIASVKAKRPRMPEAPEARRMADEHNRRLRERLQITPTVGASVGLQASLNF